MDWIGLDGELQVFEDVGDGEDGLKYKGRPHKKEELDVSGEGNVHFVPRWISLRLNR